MTYGAIKTFSDLQTQVIRKGLCSKCGGCVSFCTAGTLNALELGEDGLPRFADEDRCLSCGLCYMICPETEDLNRELREAYGWTPPLGAVQSIASARSTDAAVRSAATDGGVVTALLLYLLDRHLIDGAIVTRKSTPFSREPAVATTRDELIAAAGSHFDSSFPLAELGDRYTTYSYTLPYVRNLVGRRLRNVALVGTPCQIKTIRKMQRLHILPADIIRYTIGLFCMENLSFGAQDRVELEKRYSFAFEDVVKLNVKESMRITLRDGSTLRVPFEDLDDLARPACLLCTEFANDYADLSAGGLASPDGYTTTLARTDRGRAIYVDALRQGYVEEARTGNGSGARGAKADMLEKVADYARYKQQRGEARRRELARAEQLAFEPEAALC